MSGSPIAGNSPSVEPIKIQNSVSSQCENGDFLWRVTGASQIGSAHVRSGLPNQDAIAWSANEEGGSASVYLAVADGHGGNKHFRSGVGSQIAVKTLMDEFSNFLQNCALQISMSSVKRQAEERLPHQIVKGWRSKVNEHLRDNPFVEAEWEQLASKQGASVRKLIEASPMLAYGSTILGVLITPSFILYIQLGDGDILCVSGTGEVSVPLPVDERLMGNETTSLCDQDAWAQFRTRLTPLSDASPEMILISTDGYSNSFPADDADFFKIGSDYHCMANEHGLDYIEEHLPDFLADTSARGSGDDITLGLIKRRSRTGMDALSRRIDRMAKTDDLKKVETAVEKLETHIHEAGADQLDETKRLIKAQAISFHRKANVALALAAISLISIIAICSLVMASSRESTITRAIPTR
ncbi:hypothetical protein CCAX7_62160 [Capsulimonas corticalis]|uniref:PPM-type phosphatase domain-containing protein n=1 Tax=Capsulimonas corticalis TaxID=2219043 RepID=A0A402CWJ0_9BACT|nr:PP2C family serine/threonine-protein phosphatase [Capsulimonas corticalis]BDI34165.1 hypothetical protein CCAX7_62160 [Capsulimonas corticalis]